MELFSLALYMVAGGITGGAAMAEHGNIGVVHGGRGCSIGVEGGVIAGAIIGAAAKAVIDSIVDEL